MPTGLVGLLKNYKLCKSPSIASLPVLLFIFYFNLLQYLLSVNEMPAFDAVFLFIKISYKIIYNCFGVIRV